VLRFCGSRLRRDAFAFLSYAQSNSRLAPVGELNAGGFENLTKTSDGAGTYFFASLEANDFGEQLSRRLLAFLNSNRAPLVPFGIVREALASPYGLTTNVTLDGVIERR
jgi:hypothetical protein